MSIRSHLLQRVRERELSRKLSIVAPEDQTDQTPPDPHPLTIDSQTPTRWAVKPVMIGPMLKAVWAPLRFETLRLVPFSHRVSVYTWPCFHTSMQQELLEALGFSQFPYQLLSFQSALRRHSTSAIVEASDVGKRRSAF